MKLSLIVPCYNEQDNVAEFFNQVVKVFSGKVNDYEFVFVDDGSADATYERLVQLYNTHSESSIQVLSFSRNFGKESAIFAGLSNARGDLACIIDADLQQRPEVVLQMLDIIEGNEDIDCVAAYQKARKESKLMSAVKSFFYKTINKIADVEFVNGASDFRLMRRNMIDALLKMTEYHRFSKGLFSWVGFNTKYIPYEADERLNGTSKWGAGKLFKYALEGIFAFSTAPLRFSTYVGLLSSFASVIYLIVVVLKKLISGIDVPGYATIVVLILLIGGIQLFSLGIMGEYFSKMYVQVKNRPIYILKSHLDGDSDD
ncbi:MAG: glycosyltransferase family 2 protein, partial [Eubacterium sp.]